MGLKLLGLLITAIGLAFLSPFVVALAHGIWWLLTEESLTQIDWSNTERLIYSCLLLLPGVPITAFGIAVFTDQHS